MDTSGYAQEMRTAVWSMPEYLDPWPILIGPRVRPVDRAAYNVDVQMQVQPEQQAALHVGATVAVLVDPANPENVTIDFAAPWSG